MADRKRRWTGAGAAAVIALAVAAWFALTCGEDAPEEDAPAEAAAAGVSAALASGSGGDPPPATASSWSEGAAAFAARDDTRREYPLAPIRGRVVSAGTEQPVDAAELTFDSGAGVTTVRSDAGGRFELRPDRAGTYLLADVRAAGHLPYTPAWGQSPIQVQARPGTPVDGMVLRLEPTYGCQGRILDGERRPLAGAEVSLFARTLHGRNEPVTIRPDPGGTFAFDAFNGAALIARKTGHVPAFARLGPASRLKPGEPCTVDLVLKGGAPTQVTIRGQVVDPEGHAVSDAVVLAEPWRAGPRSLDAQGKRLSPYFAVARTSSDPEGRFALEVPGAGARFRLWAMAPGFSPTASEVVAGSADTVVLRLVRGAVLAGRVSDASGAPVKLFTIEVSARHGVMTRSAIDNRTFVSPDGRFELNDVPAGELAVVAIAKGYAPSAEVRVTMEAAPGSRGEANFVLARAARISGQVVDAATRAPVADVRVALEVQVGPTDGPVPVSPSVRTDGSGHFELEIGTAPQSVLFDKRGYRSVIKPVVGATPGGVLGPLTVEMTALKEGEEGGVEMAGVGAVIGGEGDELVFQRLLPDGGAARAGVRPGDVLLRVDGVAVAELGFFDAVQRLRGPEGTMVNVLVRRTGSGVEEPVAIQRLKIVSR